MNVSCFLIHTLSLHGQTHRLDSMHPCLNVDEVVRLIAHELVASSGKGPAISLACRSKSLEDPALGALWAEQWSLYPLLESLPSDLWKEDEHSVSAPKACVCSLSLFDFKVL